MKDFIWKLIIIVIAISTLVQGDVWDTIGWLVFGGILGLLWNVDSMVEKYNQSHQ